MSTGDDARTTDTNGESRRIEAHFIKSNLFRVIHVDGAWGGLTPQMNIQMALYSERTPIPQQVIYEATSTGLVDVERTGRQGIVREVEADVIISLDVARSLVKWLQEKIDKAADVNAELASMEAAGETQDSDNDDA